MMLRFFGWIAIFSGGYCGFSGVDCCAKYVRDLLDKFWW